MRRFPSTALPNTKDTERPFTSHDCGSMGLLHTIAEVLRRYSSWCWIFDKPKHPHTQDDFQAFGREGEMRAARFLRKHGYKILYRNFRPPVGGEVDLICRGGSENVLVFIEVKSRASDRYGAPASAVGLNKQRRLILAAQYWLSQLDRSDVRVQFDVLEVIYNRGSWDIRHLVDAFSADQTFRGEAGAANPAASRGGDRPRRGYANAGQFRRHRGRG